MQSRTGYEEKKEKEAEKKRTSETFAEEPNYEVDVEIEDVKEVKGRSGWKGRTLKILHSVPPSLSGFCATRKKKNGGARQRI